MTAPDLAARQRRLVQRRRAVLIAQRRAERPGERGDTHRPVQPVGAAAASEPPPVSGPPARR